MTRKEGGRALTRGRKILTHVILLVYFPVDINTDYYIKIKL